MKVIGARRKKKLLVIQPYLAPYRLDIYNYLAGEYDLLVLYWYRSAPEQKFDLDLLSAQCRFKYEFIDFGFNIRFQAFRFDFFLKAAKFKPDIIIGHEFGFLSFSSLFLKRVLNCKVVVTCDDSMAVFEAQLKTKGFWKSGMVKWIDGLICTSNLVRQRYVTMGISEQRTCWHPLFPDDRVFRRNFNNAHLITEYYVERYQLQPHKSILYIGRLAPEKNILLLLAAFGRLAKREENLRLIIVGEGPMRSQIESKIKELGISDFVILPGRYDGAELIAWYHVGDVFVLPSRQETFGAVVVEALLSGLRVVCSSAAGAHELLDAKNGSVFLNEDLDSLEAQLEF